MKSAVNRKNGKERTLALIKPHSLMGLLSCFAGRFSCAVLVDVINAYLGVGLQLEKISVVRLSQTKVRALYRQHARKPWFPELVRAMTVDPCVAMIWRGHDAISLVRSLNGHTNPAEARPGTLRHKYGDRRNRSNNAVHGSENPRAAGREIKIIFG